MRLGRESFYAVLDSAATEALPYLHAMLTVTSQTAEAAEGIAAFIEKRPPAWRTIWRAAAEHQPNDRNQDELQERAAWRSGH